MDSGNKAGDGQERKKKESIFELNRFIDNQIRVKFAGGRESSGTLKGFDSLLNIVLDDTIECLLDPDDPYTRHLGLVVCRGTTVTLICPMYGMESISNPFVQQE